MVNNRLVHGGYGSSVMVRCHGRFARSSMTVKCGYVWCIEPTANQCPIGMCRGEERGIDAKSSEGNKPDEIGPA
eukprot:1367983-Amorphochlora_amoeboformis.AAC.1